MYVENTLCLPDIVCQKCTFYSVVNLDFEFFLAFSALPLYVLNFGLEKWAFLPPYFLSTYLLWILLSVLLLWQTASMDNETSFPFFLVAVLEFSIYESGWWCWELLGRWCSEWRKCQSVYDFDTSFFCLYLLSLLSTIQMFRCFIETCMLCSLGGSLLNHQNSMMVQCKWSRNHPILNLLWTVTVSVRICLMFLQNSCNLGWHLLLLFIRILRFLHIIIQFLYMFMYWYTFDNVLQYLFHFSYLTAHSSHLTLYQKANTISYHSQILAMRTHRPAH